MELEPEVEFAQKLACNQPKVREKVLKKLGKWFERRSVSEDAFTEDGMLKLWKGLFFYFWNCDKPLFQEERADLICKYIHVFKRTEYSFLYMKTFFQTLSREWYGIDRYRIEKFMMLVRKFLRESYVLLQSLQWNLKYVKHFRKVLSTTILNPGNVSLGLKIHITDIYMEELARVGFEQLSPRMTQWFLLPFYKVLEKCDDLSFLQNVAKDVFLYLINQDADETQFHKFPILQFDPVKVQNLLLKYANEPSIKKKNMKVIYYIIKEYENFKNGVSSFDLLFKDQSSGPKLKNCAIQKAALNMISAEERITRENKEYRKKKKQKKIDM